MKPESVEKTIIAAASIKDFNTLQNAYIELTINKAKMDQWFDKFLDMFGEKLETCDKSDPVKKLYNAKFEEYSKISRVIRIAETYMKA